MGFGKKFLLRWKVSRNRRRPHQGGTSFPPIADVPRVPLMFFRRLCAKRHAISPIRIRRHTTQHVECWRRMPSSDSTLCLSTSDDFCGRKPYLTAVESPICPRLQNGWFHAKVRMPFTAHAAKVVNGIREWSPCRRKTMECKASWRHPCWSS